MATIEAIFRAMILIRSGIILLKFIILRSFILKKWSLVSRKWGRFYSSVIFMVTQWRKMRLYMVVMIPETLRKVNSFPYLWVKFSKDSLSKTVVFLIWKNKKVQVELFCPSSSDIVIYMRSRVLSADRNMKTYTSQWDIFKSWVRNSARLYWFTSVNR
jgi:hypothetical protein